MISWGVEMECLNVCGLVEWCLLCVQYCVSRKWVLVASPHLRYLFSVLELWLLVLLISNTLSIIYGYTRHITPLTTVMVRAAQASPDHGFCVSIVY